MHRIIQCKVHPIRIKQVLSIQLKASALQLLSTCLEGRDSMLPHIAIASQIEPLIFENIRDSIYQVVIDIRKQYDRIDIKKILIKNTQNLNKHLPSSAQNKNNNKNIYSTHSNNKKIQKVTLKNVAEVEVVALNAYSAIKSIKLKLIGGIKTFADKAILLEKGRKLNKLDKV